MSDIRQSKIIARNDWSTRKRKEIRENEDYTTLLEKKPVMQPLQNWAEDLHYN